MVETAFIDNPDDAKLLIEHEYDDTDIEKVAALAHKYESALANYGKVLANYEVNSDDFIKQCKELGTIDPGNFGKLQDEFIKIQYYNVSAKKTCRCFGNACR